MNISTTIATPQAAVKFSHAFRLSASIFYDILLIISLIINIFQMAVYIKGRKLLKNMAFFAISWQMLANNLLMLVVMITFMTTVIFSDDRIFSDDVYFVLSFIQSFAYNGLLLFAFLLTINRLMVFATPKLEKIFFGKIRIYIVIGIFWVLTALLVTGIMLSPCPIIAKPKDMGFGSECLSGNANIYNYIGQYVATYFPIVMIVNYVLIYIEIKIGIFCNGWCCVVSNLLKKNPNQLHNRAEIKLLFQAALICSTFFVQNFCWTYLPFFTSNFTIGEELIFLAIMCSSILLYSVNAIVILAFNGTVKRVAISFFKPDSNQLFVSQYRSSLTVSVGDTRRISIMPSIK